METVGSVVWALVGVGILAIMVRAALIGMQRGWRKGRARPFKW